MFNADERQQSEASNRRTHLSESEVLDVLTLARQSNVRDWAILCVAFNHGLRVSEACALTLDSINWKDRTLTVKRLKNSLTTTQTLAELRGKPALNEVLALRAYLKVRTDDGSGRLFTGQKGSLTRWTLTRIFREYCERVSADRVARGLAPIAENARHFHVLRHSIATLTCQKGMVLEGGHWSPRCSEEHLS